MVDLGPISWQLVHVRVEASAWILREEVVELSERDGLNSLVELALSPELLHLLFCRLIFPVVGSEVAERAGTIVGSVLVVVVITTTVVVIVIFIRTGSPIIVGTRSPIIVGTGSPLPFNTKCCEEKRKNENLSSHV